MALPVSSRAALAERVEMTERSHIKPASRSAYCNSNVRFLLWLSANEPAVLNEPWLEVVFDDANLEYGRAPDLNDALKPFMKKRLVDYDVALPPVHFNVLTPQMFKEWIVSLSAGFESLSTHRSAIKLLFSDYRQAFTSEWESAIALMFKGLKRVTADELATGARTKKSGRKETGKKPMEFGFFVALARAFWTQKIVSKSSAFSLLFMILSWNLMSRASNIVQIQFDWSSDALTVLFCTMKTDKGGERKFPRHVYANPLRPEICPILALGIYLLQLDVPTDAVDSKLFPGSSQYTRFSELFKRLLKGGIAELLAFMKGIAEWGTHSFRKGAATYTCSGSTAAPHITSVCNRAGWKQPGVLDIYVTYSGAGDQYVGRVVCGLPLDSASFSILPPFFEGLSDVVIRDAVAVCFPSLIGRVKHQVLQFALASVVYHYQWLKDNVDVSNPLWATPLFTNVELLQQLREHVVCRLPGPQDTIIATGLPPHVLSLRAMSTLQTSVVDLSNAVCQKLDQASTKITEDVLKGLDDRQVQSVVTPTSLKSQILEALSSFGLDKLVAAAQPAAPVVPEVPGAVVVPPLTTYCWGGKLGRLLPADFAFPKTAKVREMWTLYIVGNPLLGYPPLRLVTSDHVCDRNTRKRFSDFKKLMRMIEEKVKESGAWTEEANSANAVRMYELGKAAVALPGKSSCGYTRRSGDLGWRYVLKMKQQGPSKRPRTNEEDEDEVDEDDLDEDEVASVLPSCGCLLFALAILHGIAFWSYCKCICLDRMIDNGWSYSCPTNL